MKRYAQGGMSADTEADLQALKTLQQPDTPTFSRGPKRRFRRGKVKRYEDERGEHMPYAKPMRKGGSVKSSASRRADGCAVKGKTRGKFV
jgi:hypothetical protein